MLEEPASTKDKLIRAAMRLVAQEGFTAATTAAIADAAGVAEGTLYRHFASKDELMIGAYRKLKADVFAAVTARQDSDAPVQARVKAFWRAMFAAYRADPIGFVFGQRFAESPLAKLEKGAAVEAFADRVNAMRDEGVAAGVFKPLPADLMRNLLIAPVSYLLKTELAGRRWTEEELDAAAEGALASWRV